MYWTQILINSWKYNIAYNETVLSLYIQNGNVFVHLPFSPHIIDILKSSTSFAQYIKTYNRIMFAASWNIVLCRIVYNWKKIQYSRFTCNWLILPLMLNTFCGCSTSIFIMFAEIMFKYCFFGNFHFCILAVLI